MDVTIFTMPAADGALEHLEKILVGSFVLPKAVRR
jgi:hypothetical protein